MWSLDLTTTKPLAQSLAVALEDFAQEGAFAIFEDVNDESVWRMQLTLESEPDLKELQRLTAIIAAELNLETPQWALEQLPEVDWLAENRKSFPPLRIGSFYIYGSHEMTLPPAGTIPLKIDASTAFGTGSHPTTSGCLIALEDLQRSGYQPKNALDLGCGTGILAMAVYQLFGCPTVASDIDPEAIEKTIFNLQENDLLSDIVAVTSSGFEESHLKNAQPFDLIVANILARPLMDMANDVVSALSPEGRLILSGILSEQAQDVINAYAHQGCTLMDQRAHKEWSVLVFRK